MKFYEYNKDTKRIDVFDERWYYKKDVDRWYRSVTTILGIIDKGYNYDEWLRDVGHNSEIIVDRAGKLGTIVHSMIQNFLLGKTIKYFDMQEVYGESQAVKYYERFLLWTEFWKELNSKHVVAYNKEDIEKVIYSDSHGYAGTADLILLIDGERVLFDWKTGNHVGNQAHLQVVAYMAAEGISRSQIIHLPAKKPNKKGYRIIDVSYTDEMFDLFLSTKKVFELENRDDPKFINYPIEINIKDLEAK